MAGAFVDNTLLKAYNTWPIRLYVLEAGRIVYTGKQKPLGYSPEKSMRS